MKTKTIAGIALAAFSLVSAASAAPLKSAVVTTVVNDVSMSENRSAARKIETGAKVTGASTLLTGNASRAAMTFPDKTVTRVGANSVFRFSSGSRDMEIAQGSFLLQVPKNAGGAKIRTATVTAAITGTTTMMEFNPGKYIKFICLEGTANLVNKKGGKVAVPAGQMLVMHPDAKNFPNPIIVNIAKMMKTSALADDKTFGDLEAEAEDAIDETIALQMEQRKQGSLLPARLGSRGTDWKNTDGTRSTIREDYFYDYGGEFPNGPGGEFPNPNDNPNTAP